MGSLATTTSKDSSLGSPGYLSALIQQVRTACGSSPQPPGGGGGGERCTLPAPPPLERNVSPRILITRPPPAAAASAASAASAQLTYVDEHGLLVTLEAGRDAQALGDFINSAGMMGVVVSVVLRCRPRRPIRSVITVVPGGPGLARRLLEMRQRCDNLFAIVKPAASAAVSFAYVEQRHATRRTSKPLWRVVGRGRGGCARRALRFQAPPSASPL